MRIRNAVTRCFKRQWKRILSFTISTISFISILYQISSKQEPTRHPFYIRVTPPRHLAQFLSKQCCNNDLTVLHLTDYLFPSHPLVNTGVNFLETRVASVFFARVEKAVAKVSTVRKIYQEPRLSFSVLDLAPLSSFPISPWSTIHSPSGTSRQPAPAVLFVL